MITIERLEKLAEECRLSEEKTRLFADELYALAYMNPALFKLDKLDPDSKSDFLLHLYGFFRKIPFYYNPERGAFLQYVQLIFSRNYHSWLRVRIKKTTTEKSVFSCLSQDYSELLFTEAEPVYGECEIPDFHAEICRRGLKKLLYRDRLLMLAFKSAHQLTASHIKKLAGFTGCTEDELWKLRERIVAANEKRCVRFEVRKKGINTSYILKNRYLLELEKLNPDGVLFQHIRRAYFLQYGLWMNKVCKRGFRSLSVPNHILAAEFRVRKNVVDNALLYTRRKLLENDAVEQREKNVV